MINVIGRTYQALKLIMFALSVTCGLCLAVVVVAQDATKSTPVVHESCWWPKSQGAGLGTIRYQPSKQEEPFFTRLAADEVVTGSAFDRYEIATKDKKYVGWFGIVREIEEDKSSNRTRLTVEHKYFDGFTDAHLQAVSFNGAGDFHALLQGTHHRIPALSLVKVYGTVSVGKAGEAPRVEVLFLRDWHWGTFTFLSAYGTQVGSEEWRKLNNVALDDIYDAWPHPSHRYYEERLGKRPDAPQIRQRLIEAAGPLPPESQSAMERLADLLAVGHGWSQAEWSRQSNENSQISKIVKATSSQRAAVRLLIQALQENDERVSWSAADRFAQFDETGSAIPLLAKLLTHDSLRVRAGAARVFSFAYASQGEAVVVPLASCLADANAELKPYFLDALSNIGSNAIAAIPALQKALNDDDMGMRVNVVHAMWNINPQPEYVIPVLTKVLENGDPDARHAAAKELKEMGNWAAPAAPALIKSLSDKEWTLRCEVAEALGEIGPEAAAAIPHLVKLAQSDEENVVRSNAIRALGSIGDSSAIPALVALLKDSDEAIDAIERFGPQAISAIPELEELVKKGGTTSWMAAKSLGKIDADGVSTPVLIDALKSSASTTRRFAAYGLGHIGRKAGTAEKALRERLTDSDPGVRIAAAGAHWAVSGKSEESVQVLRTELAKSRQSLAPMWAADELAAIGPEAKEAIPELVTSLKSETEYVVSSSATALGKIGPAAATSEPALTALLKESGDEYVRACAARALWRIQRSEQTLPMLRDILSNSRDFMAVSEAAETVGEMGSQATGTEQLLQRLLKHRNSFVRNAAATALTAEPHF